MKVNCKNADGSQPTADCDHKGGRAPKTLYYSGDSRSYGRKPDPQGLKPVSFTAFSGTAESRALPKTYLCNQSQVCGVERCGAKRKRIRFLMRVHGSGIGPRAGRAHRELVALRTRLG